MLSFTIQMGKDVLYRRRPGMTGNNPRFVSNPRRRAV